MKIWVDDIRPEPKGYIHFYTVNQTIKAIQNYERYGISIEVIDLDHDAGEYNFGGGDYIKILDWLEATGRNYPIHIHSLNPVGVQNMKAIIKRNGWEYYGQLDFYNLPLS